MPSTHRRAVLRSIGAASVALAGCQTGPTTGTDTATPSASPTGTPTEPPTGTPTDTPTLEPRRCGPAARPDAAWPAPGRSPAGDRYVADWSGFGEAPTADWTFVATEHEPSGVNPRLRQPLVAGGLLYTVLAYVPTPQIADPGGHLLQCHDPADGAVRWTYELPRVPTEPAVFGAHVVVGVGGTLHAVDRRDGTREWTREFDGELEDALPTAERLYVRVAASDGADVYALAPDGSTVWSRSFDRRLFASPVLGPDHVHVAALDGTVFAFDPERGVTAWATATPQDGGEEGSSPYVQDLVATHCGVAVVTDGDVEMLDPGGAFVWRAEGTFRRLATDGETVYGSTSTGQHADETEVRAFDARTGERRWAKTAPVDHYTAPVVSPGEVYLQGDDSVLALSPDDGSVAWRSEGAVEAMALANDALYVTRKDVTTASLEVLR